MKTLLMIIISILIIFSSTVPAWASVDLNAYLPVSGDPVTPEFKFDKTYQIDYPNGGKLKDALAERSLTVTCFANSSNNQSVKQLMESINNQISSSKSAVVITHLDLSYMFRLRGTPKYAAMDYLLILTPTITGYLLNDGNQITPSTLDASWMSFAINDPVVIDTKSCRDMKINYPVTTNTKNYSDIEINYPLNTIKNVLPDVYNAIYNTTGEGVFDQAFSQNLIDSTPLLQTPLDKWDSLFDPAYTLDDTAESSSSKGEKVGATAFSTGLGWQSIIQSPSGTIDTDFTADTKYHISKVDRPYASATINVEGHANPDRYLGNQAIVTILQPGPVLQTCCALPWYDIPWIWVAIAGVAIAGFFVFYFRHFKD